MANEGEVSGKQIWSQTHSLLKSGKLETLDADGVLSLNFFRQEVFIILLSRTFLVLLNEMPWV